jgi:dihydrolipoamide dehydrogenase
VTVVEYLERILPGMDAEIAVEAKRILESQGLEFRLGCRVTGARTEAGGCVVEYEGGEPIRGDRVLVAVGRAPMTADLGLEAVGITPDARGRIPVDERFATTADGIYAIGDVIKGPMLAHKASDEGTACVEQIAGGRGRVDYGAIPSVVYTAPEIAAVGRTEEELQAAGIQYRKGVFQFRANGRARVLGHTEGRVKMLADAKTDRVLGVHILGPRAGDLIAEATAAIAFGASSEDIARTSHAHPTLAETLREAALAVDRRQIH